MLRASLCFTLGIAADHTDTIHGRLWSANYLVCLCTIWILDPLSCNDWGAQFPNMRKRPRNFLLCVTHKRSSAFSSSTSMPASLEPFCTAHIHRHCLPFTDLLAGADNNLRSTLQVILSVQLWTPSTGVHVPLWFGGLQSVLQPRRSALLNWRVHAPDALGLGDLPRADDGLADLLASLSSLGDNFEPIRKWSSEDKITGRHLAP